MNRIRAMASKPTLVVMTVAMLFTVGWAHFTQAAPGTGQPQFRVAAVDTGGHVEHYVMVTKGIHTPSAGAGTAVAGQPVCFDGDPTLMAAQLYTSGTMTGLAASVNLSIVLQVSDNLGKSWRNVGSSFGNINATLTPAGGQDRVALANVAASTAIVWGDCFRVVTTWSGTPTALSLDYGVTLYGQ